MYQRVEQLQKDSSLDSRSQEYAMLLSFFRQVQELMAFFATNMASEIKVSIVWGLMSMVVEVHIPWTSQRHSLADESYPYNPRRLSIASHGFLDP